MSTIRHSMMAGAVLVGALAISGCKVKEDTPEPEATPTDGPRSIFQDDPANGGSALPQPALPPLETTLSFADGTSGLTEAVRAELATVIGSPQVREGGAIVLRGHSDSQGSDESGLTASRERAEAVRDFLVENGLAEERIEIIAFGEQNPVEPNALPDGSPNAEGRAANRRVELFVGTGASTEREQTLIESLSEAEDGDETREGPGQAD